MASRSSASSSSSSSARLRSLLSRSETLGAETDVALARCESDLGRAAELVALTVARTQALRAARDEIRASLATSETALEHLDAARRLEPVVLAGPRGDNLSAFLMALSKLDEAAAFLSRHKSGLVAAAAAAESVAALRSDGNALALRDYEATTRGAYDSYAGGDDDGDARREQKQQQQQQPQGIAVEARKRELTKRATASKQTRLRSLARALVSGGGPEASAPSVLAFLISEKRQEGEAGGVEKDGKGCMKRGEKKKI